MDARYNNSNNNSSSNSNKTRQVAVYIPDNALVHHHPTPAITAVTTTTAAATTTVPSYLPKLHDSDPCRLLRALLHRPCHLTLQRLRGLPRMAIPLRPAHPFLIITSSSRRTISPVTAITRTYRHQPHQRLQHQVHFPWYCEAVMSRRMREHLCRLPRTTTVTTSRLRRHHRQPPHPFVPVPIKCLDRPAVPLKSIA
jgi:hypothetical protein